MRILVSFFLRNKILRNENVVDEVFFIFELGYNIYS